MKASKDFCTFLEFLRDLTISFSLFAATIYFLILWMEN